MNGIKVIFTEILKKKWKRRENERKRNGGERGGPCPIPIVTETFENVKLNQVKRSD